MSSLVENSDEHRGADPRLKWEIYSPNNLIVSPPLHNLLGWAHSLVNYFFAFLAQSLQNTTVVAKKEVCINQRFKLCNIV